MRFQRGFFIVLILVWIIASISSNLVSQEDRLSKLKEKFLKQQKVLQELRKKLEEKEKSKKDYTEKIVEKYLSTDLASDSPTNIIAGYDNGFFIQTSDGNFKLKIKGYLRHHALIYGTRVDSENTIRASESRIDFHIYIMKDIHIRIRPDWSDDMLRVREAFVEYLGIPYLKMRVGAWITPFSMEFCTPPEDLLAIAYSPYLTLAPSIPFRDVGAMIYGNGLPLFLGEFFKDYFSYAVGVFNGEGIDRLNAKDDMLLIARGTFYPLTNEERSVFIQSSVFYTTNTNKRDAEIDLPAVGKVVFPTTNLNDDDIEGTQVGVSTAFRYWKDNLRLEGEMIWARFNRDFTGAGNNLSPLEIFGASAGVSYLYLIKEEQHLGVEPLFKFSYTTIDNNGDRGNIDGQTIWEVVIGTKFHFNKHIRIDFNWVMYDLDDNSTYKKDNQIIHSFIFQFLTRW